LNGELLFVDTAGVVHYRDGVSYGTPHGTSWGTVDLPETAVHVSAGETGQVWILYGNGDCAILDKTNNGDISGDASSGYTIVELGEEGRLENTGLVQMDVGDWEVWGINKYHEVYSRTTSANMITGTEWV
jgi:hypothetical protein